MEVVVKKLEEYRSAYEIFKLCSRQEDFKSKKICFLDSSLKNKYGKFSIIGYDCYMELAEKENITYINGEKSKRNFEEVLDEILEKNSMENETKLPILSGAIAYFSYDYGRKFENIESKHRKEIDIPEAVVRFYDSFIVEDIEAKETYIAYRSQKNYEEILEILQNEASKNEIPKHEKLAKFKSNFEKSDYLNAVQKMINYIVEGDVYIANMTQTLCVESEKNPLEVFDYLRKWNPSPFGNYFDYEDFQIVGASPERFIKIENGSIETRPIKGTRKRGSTAEEDESLKNELKNSEKDRSELLMIVDLERNDLHRICDKKSVKVTELFEVETYSTVFHLVSTIIGKLKNDYKFSELIKSVFPGGSITGAPKIRAMQIIDELEHSRRNIYTGSLGYISFDGKIDLNIIIRTLLYKDGKYYLGVGGGITCESDLEFEYEETLQKAKALLEALGD